MGCRCTPTWYLTYDASAANPIGLTGAASYLDAVGKGARNRRKRNEANSAGDLVGELLQVETFEGFSELLSDHPDLVGDGVLHVLDSARREAGGRGLAFEPWYELVKNARADPEDAWFTFDDAMTAQAEVGEELQAELDAIEKALNERRPVEAIERADAALPKAVEANLAVYVGYFEGQRAKALFQLPVGDRAENLEDAIAGLNRALDSTIEAEVAAQLMMHLGLAWGERVRGDRAENLEVAVNLLREALKQLTPKSPPWLGSLIQTNLANALLRRERGDRAANLREAADVSRASLEHRSPEAGGFDWAHTQLNLGAIHQDLAALEGDDPDAAIEAYEAVIAEADRVGEDWLVGGAHFSLGRLRRIATEHGPEELFALAEAGEEELQLERDAELLAAALEDLETAYRLTEDDPDPIRRGRVLDELAAVYEKLGRPEDTIAVGREAISKLSPTSAPRECADAAWRLGGLLAEQGEWAEAADAYREANEAAEFLFHGRLDTETREQEARNAGHLSRWGAFALARAGDAVGAALVLESGRTRELRRRVQLGPAEEERLGALPGDLRDAYLGATAELAKSQLGPASSAPARALQEVLAAIRSFPGFEDFATGARLEDLNAAAEADWPLLYVNPTPAGTLLLRVEVGDDEPTIEVLILKAPIAMQVFMRLMAGDIADAPELIETVEVHSYLASIVGYGPGALEDSLDEALPWIGEAIAKPIREWLGETSARGVTLVPCGPIGAVPIAAAPWNERAGATHLLDHYEIRYAPSAILSATSLRRSSDRAALKPYLVALADPNQNLRAAGPEVEEIARRFGVRVTRAEGDDASSNFLRSNIQKATHVHLACHAGGGLFDPEDGGVVLSDGLLSALELTAAGQLHSRCVVISACQTAVPEITEAPGEVFATSTVVLIAGSACAIASLWPVDDAATAFLMTRLYEEMMVNGLRPPEALRRAQLWLREVTEEQKTTFLGEHPALEAEVRRRTNAGDPPGRRGPGAPTAPEGNRPFSHPVYWAPFIAVGA